MITAAHPLSVDLASDPQEHAPRFTIDTESYSSDFAVLRATGELDMTARLPLMDSIEELTSEHSDVRVDLSAVTFIYSGAASVIVDAVTASTAEVRIFAPTRPVRMILDVLGAGHLIVDSLDPQESQR
ncbi:anti-sigma factor antagonist [Rhodococcus sp. RS1C4]|uniref:STAS domain-containing protein n=1 Tax=Nocardiaceae TaxID=85025 RepID=UPI0003817AEA|nr:MULTISPECIES: STAS domain-containing protein [Rhodococcus]OZC56148.1 anti-sigma factor antagonist [Rhodococcus sp. RS1C4]OZC60202.1 anti-sigma factor antagonist [Rhodococcus sp. 06-621-2]OZC78530.1 anti-sigma factor antagonist [Rhodococcus sp. 06-418-1B]OZD10827.1 anti-sigma factor antagonist [Rhodococcus sp. 06-156-4C]OZD11512.1 anti-sigma factor antagonist [Rhodococcus sp. 06-156-3C]